MESFDAALALISETMGFQDVGYTKLNEGAKRDMWSMYKANLSATDNRRMSEYGRGWEPRADVELVQAVESFASIDLRMYAHAVRAFDKKVRWLRRGTSLVYCSMFAWADCLDCHRFGIMAPDMKRYLQIYKRRLHLMDGMDNGAHAGLHFSQQSPAELASPSTQASCAL